MNFRSSPQCDSKHWELNNWMWWRKQSETKQSIRCSEMQIRKRRNRLVDVLRWIFRFRSWVCRQMWSVLHLFNYNGELEMQIVFFTWIQISALVSHNQMLRLVANDFHNFNDTGHTHTHTHTTSSFAAATSKFIEKPYAIKLLFAVPYISPPFRLSPPLQIHANCFGRWFDSACARSYLCVLYTRILCTRVWKFNDAGRQFL